jgi:hypothetical protein
LNQNPLYFLKKRTAKEGNVLQVVGKLAQQQGGGSSFAL